MRWVLESGVFGSGCDLGPAARAAGHEVRPWTEDVAVPRGSMFHGSLEIAARIAAAGGGSFCDVAALRCSAWYPTADRWRLNRDWQLLPASQLVAEPPPWPRLFVRPDSPLKPFSGRVVDRADLTLAALDFGFYFDDPELPVVVAPAVPVEQEWRYVVADRRVVAGSGYAADGRRALPDDPGGAPWAYAQAVAADLAPPEAVYVLDVALSAGELRLVELNPFSGADLYACDPAAVVAAVAGVLSS